VHATSTLEARRRLQALLGLTAEQAARAVDETLDSFRLEADEYIAARHATLQSEGVANPEIFERIAFEVRSMLFRGPPLTARQIRRRIYG
jgi:hypothetical protein